MFPENFELSEDYRQVEIRIFTSTVAGKYPVELSVQDWCDFPSAVMQLNHFLLDTLASDPKSYGQALGEALFADEVLGRAFRETIAVVQGMNKGLRIRLRLDTPEMQAIHWERLYYPLDGAWYPIGITASTPFSRYVPVRGWKPLQLVAEQPLKILTIIASSTDLNSYYLDPIATTERSSLRATLDALPNVTVTYLETGTSSPPTLNQLRKALANHYHLVHFLCHGAITDGGTVLYLESEDGRVDPVKTDQLINCFKELTKPPLFCFLAACESATRRCNDAFIPLGPALVKDGGSQAVVAMADRVGVVTAQRFTDQFYTRLLKHGMVDVAVNEARALVQSEWDWSAPILFMRLKHGQLFPASSDLGQQSNLSSFHLDENADHAPIYPSTRRDFYAHIFLSSNYIERKEVLRHVRTKLLADTPIIALTSALHDVRPNALHGMGGIGKTVIARALCDDPAVQEAFPDGILWVTIGQEPELVSAIRELVYVLGGTIAENAPTINSLKNILAKLLRDRACLLILDDVWQRTHVEAFLVGGSRCRILLTTRDAEIAHGLGAKVQAIPVMKQTEAISLLEEWADGHLANTDPVLKDQIVERLGYLPLAVKLAGAQLRRSSPDEWLATFDIGKLKSPRHEEIHDSLELTFELSLGALDEVARYLYVSLAIFKEDEATPQTGIERLWQGIVGLSTNAARDLLDDLSARALLEITPHSSSQTRSILLHDLLHDLIRMKLGNKDIAVHRVLLDTYRTTCGGAGWHSAADDGYLYDHLAYHLSACEANNELRQLFSDQRWLQVRLPQRNYIYDGYLEDLGLAWKYTINQVKQRVETNQEPQGFADCIRFLLIYTSINSLAESYVPELIVWAVKDGRLCCENSKDEANSSLF